MYSKLQDKKAMRKWKGHCSARRMSAQVPRDLNLDGFRAPIEELLSPDIIAEVSEDLKQDWFVTRRDEYRLLLARIWSLVAHCIPSVKCSSSLAFQKEGPMWRFF